MHNVPHHRWLVVGRGAQNCERVLRAWDVPHVVQPAGYALRDKARLQNLDLVRNIPAARFEAEQLTKLWRRVLIGDRKSTRLNSSHVASSYAVFCSKDPPVTPPRRR